MYKKILVGIDNSELSTKALRIAANLAKTCDAELYIFHAVNHHYSIPLLLTPLALHSSSIITSATAMDPDTMRAHDEQVTERIIADAREYVTKLNLGVEVRSYFHGELDISPAEYALDFAKKHNVDLIVFGRAGHHSRLRPGLVGTVAMKIINDAPCPVLIVR